MRREDVLDLVQRIPPIDRTKIVLVLLSGTSVTVDAIFKTEPEYLVVRGREAGTNDDGRAFFIPYELIGFLKLERSVKLNELRGMYGMPAEAEDGVAAAEAAPAEATTPQPAGAPTPPPAPAKAAPVDPAAIARQNLLERIRAARTSVRK